MPHVMRKRSASGFYHVITKGQANRIVFEDEDDREVFLGLLEEAKERNPAVIHAYCLMSNHVHLLMEDRGDDLSGFMKTLNERYAMYYSRRWSHIEGVFRKPFWSEPIEEEAYLLCCLRYIHANPAAAGLSPASRYPWSSVREYLDERDGIAKTSFMLDILGGRDGFVAFSAANKATALPYPTSKLRGHLTDDEANRIARDVLGMAAREVSCLPRAQREASVALLYTRGFDVARIGRLTGLSRKSIELLVGKGR